ncbi:unnamed protein product [Microthlaspi erraticum]|uniref:Uncharacterized protein n=1 Tax=Microthlaspi erraticum TaxID=1685480 RepID=A0A6D2INU6_9BRAS|nr:unnamed protein product [Microthlaspi erraticum]
MQENMKWYVQGLMFDTSVPPKELGGKVVVRRGQTAIRDTPLDRVHSLDRACSWLDRVVPRVGFLFFLNPFLQDLAEKNAEIKDKRILQDRHGNSSQVSLF